MPARIIDGKAIAQSLNQETKNAVSEFTAANGFAPTLAVVLVGEDPASQVYVRNKIRTAGEIGINSIEILFDKSATQGEIEEKVLELSHDPKIDGILVQLPLPKNLDEDSVIEKIDPLKDVDGLSEKSAGKLVLGKPGLRPCTPKGSVILAKSALGENLSGLNVVVVGRSILVGKPAALLFLAENCTVTIAHSKTKNLKELCQSADILVAAIGRPKMIGVEYIKSGACVIDVGINRIEDSSAKSGSRLVGDIDFENAKEIAGSITPVPGGVGPMTIACLMANTLEAAILRRSL